jgi:hypothetical protein
MQKIKAVWDPEDIDASWKIETEIPHETFDIMEDGELFCRGVVFHVDDVKAVRQRHRVSEVRHRRRGY